MRDHNKVYRYLIILSLAVLYNLPASEFINNYDIVLKTILNEQYQKICDEEVQGVRVIFKSKSKQLKTEGGIRFVLEIENIYQIVTVFS